MIGKKLLVIRAFYIAGGRGVIQSQNTINQPEKA